MPNQQIEKSIIFQLPRNQKSTFNRYEQQPNYTAKYKLQQQVSGPANPDTDFLCLNCQRYINEQQIDQHSLSHLKKEYH